MLKYLIVALCDTSVAFCHYSNKKKTPRLIPEETLREVLRWAMMENVSLQVLYPTYDLPLGHKAALDEVEHVKIKPLSTGRADIVCLDALNELRSASPLAIPFILRTGMDELLQQKEVLFENIGKTPRLNVVFKGYELDKETLERYESFLEELGEVLLNHYRSGYAPQVNLITDRIFLDKMNNCNAGVESLTLAPDGKFYICPGFYQEGEEVVGDLISGPSIPNRQLYKLSHAPICRICDAYQCKRCVWLNKERTLEVNTPSREQCVLAHLERNASRKLCEKLKEIGALSPERSIREIDYLDPFDKIVKK